MHDLAFFFFFTVTGTARVFRFKVGNLRFIRLGVDLCRAGLLAACTVTGGTVCQCGRGSGSGSGTSGSGSGSNDKLLPCLPVPAGFD